MDSAIHLLSSWPQVVRLKNLLPWFPVPLAGSRGMRTTLRCRRRQGRGKEGKGWGDWEKSPHGKNTEKAYTKMKNNWKKKNKNKTKSIKYFSDFQLAKQDFFQSAPVEGLLQNGNFRQLMHILRIKLYPLLIFYSSYGSVYSFSYPEYSGSLLMKDYTRPRASY